MAKARMREEQVPSAKDLTVDRGRHIVRGLGSLTVQSIVNAVLGFVLLASFVRFLSQNDYGAYASVQVSVGMAAAVAGFGLSAAVVRFLAPSPADERGSGWASAKAGLYLTVLLSATASMAMVAIAPLLSDYFLKGPSGAWVFYFGAAWLFTSSVAAPTQAILQGLRKYSLLAKILMGSRFVAVAFAVAGLVLYQSLAIAVASQVVYFGIVLVAILPALLGPLRGAEPRPRYSAVWRYAFPLGLAGLVGAIAGNADIVVVGGYLNPGSLAIYNATVQISGVLSAFFVTPLVTALFAEASFSSEREDEVRLGTGLSLRFSMLTLLPASFFAAAMAPQLFDLFSGGGPYAQGIPYLELITLFYVFTAVQAIVVNVLQSVSRTRQVLIVGAVTALGEVALSASLVPRLGLAGAAYSRVAMFVVGCALSLFFVRQYLPRPIEYRFYAKALLASAIPAMAVYIPSVMVSDRVVTIIPYTLLGVALFVVCAKVLGLLSAEDKAYLGHLLPGGLRWVLRFL